MTAEELLGWMGWGPDEIEDQPGAVSFIEGAFSDVRRQTLKEAAKAMCFWCLRKNTPFQLRERGDWYHKTRNGVDECDATPILALMEKE